MVKEVKLDQMDELIKAIGKGGGGGGSDIPTPTSEDNGKVLGVENGEYALKNPKSGLPSISSSDNGKVLQAYYDDRTDESGAQWVSAPVIKSETYTSEDITVDDKSGQAHMYLPNNSVILAISFQGNSDAIYPVEFLNYGTGGTVYISSNEYQKIVDDPNGHFTIYYI